jgi:hypothetical protein
MLQGMTIDKKLNNWSSAELVPVSVVYRVLGASGLPALPLKYLLSLPFILTIAISSNVKDPADFCPDRDPNSPYPSPDHALYIVCPLFFLKGNFNTKLYL